MTHDGYLEHLQRAREAVGIPIMASLNGATSGGWVRLAKEMEQAGASAIELNTFALATDSSQTSAELELQLLELVDGVCKAVKVPVAVKLSQSFTSLPHLCARLEEAGARQWCSSTAFISPTSTSRRWKCGRRCTFLRRRSCCRGCIGRRFSTDTSSGDIAITGGVHSAEDVLKSIMAGASVAMMVSALHIHGIEHIARVLADLRYWLDKREYASLAETRGCLSRRSVPDTSPYDRGNYIKTLSSYSLRQTVAAF